MRWLGLSLTSLIHQLLPRPFKTLTVSAHYFTCSGSQEVVTGTTSPMLLSSPTLLTCTEMVTVNDESHIDTQGYSREIFAYLREAEVTIDAFTH